MELINLKEKLSNLIKFNHRSSLLFMLLLLLFFLLYFVLFLLLVAFSCCFGYCLIYYPVYVWYVSVNTGKHMPPMCG